MVEGLGLGLRWGVRVLSFNGLGFRLIVTIVHRNFGLQVLELICIHATKRKWAVLGIMEKKMETSI